ncbi:MAG: hypothetical protein AAB581_00955 [Patescibacteria group bacterium]
MKEDKLNIIKDWKFWMRFLSLVIVAVVVVYLVPPDGPQSFNLLSNSGSFLLYVNSDYPEKRANLFLNQMFGIIPGLSWYNVCFSSKGSSYKNQGTVDNAKFVINILPLNSNQVIGLAQQWTKNLFFYESDHPKISEVFDRVVQTSIFSNLDGKPTCIHISRDERGFLYDGYIYLFEQTLDEASQKYVNKETRLLEDKNDPITLTSATLAVKTNSYALWFRRIALFLLIIGFFVSTWKLFLWVFTARKISD